jgi:hypothetical membrane protein
MRRLGNAIALLTIVAMVAQAIVGSVSDHPRAHHLWAYLLFICVPAAVVLVLNARGNRNAGWGFLVAAFGAEQAASFGLTSHWFYAVAFVLSTSLTQILPMWRATALSTFNEDDPATPTGRE